MTEAVFDFGSINSTLKREHGRRMCPRCSSDKMVQQQMYDPNSGYYMGWACEDCAKREAYQQALESLKQQFP